MVRISVFGKAGMARKAGNSCIVPYLTERRREKIFLLVGFTCTGLY